MEGKAKAERDSLTQAEEEDTSVQPSQESIGQSHWARYQGWWAAAVQLSQERHGRPFVSDEEAVRLLRDELDKNQAHVSRSTTGVRPGSLRQAKAAGVRPATKFSALQDAEDAPEARPPGPEVNGPTPSYRK